MKVPSIHCCVAWRHKGCWRVSGARENKRNKRFYRLSPRGKDVLEQLLEEWNNINASLNLILQEA